MVGTATIGRSSSSAIALARPIGVPPPSATQASAPTRRASARASSAFSIGACIRARSQIPAALAPSRAAASSASWRWPGVLTSSARSAPSRATSSGRRARLPGPNTTRPGKASWTNSSMALSSRYSAAARAALRPSSAARDRALLGGRRGGHRRARLAAGTALEDLGVFGAGRQVVADHGVPQRQQPPVQVVRPGMIAPLHRGPQLDARARRGGEDRRDRTVGAERERRIEQRVDRAEDAAAGRRREQEVGQQLEVAGALLDPDHARHLAQDPAQQLRRQIAPGHHVVDHDRHAGRVGDRPEVLEHGVVVRPEQVVHRRHLQGRDPEVADRPAAADRIARAVDDDPGDHRHGPARRLGHGRDQAAQLVLIERLALPGAAADRQTVHARREQPAHLGAHRALVDRAVRIERRGHRRDDALQLPAHRVLLPRCPGARFQPEPRNIRHRAASAMPRHSLEHLGPGVLPTGGSNLLRRRAELQPRARSLRHIA